MNKTVLYKTPRQFCEAVSELSEAKNLNLTRRPKFRFKPDDSDWWLVPSTENPHYKHGKLIFSWHDKKKQELSAGIQIEKGLDEEIKSAYASKKASKYIMTADWYWNNFIKDLDQNKVFHSLTESLNATGSLRITIDGGYVSEPTKFDPYQEKNLGWDKYTFLWDSSAKETLTLKNAKRNAFVLKLHHVKTITDLKNSLIELNKDAWLWLNLYVTTSFKISANSDTNSIADIWNEYLSNFEFIIT